MKLNSSGSQAQIYTRHVRMTIIIIKSSKKSSFCKLLSIVYLTQLDNETFAILAVRLWSPDWNNYSFMKVFDGRRMVLAV